MKIRLIKHYQMSAPGDVIDPDKPVADLLISRGIAVKVGGDACETSEPNVVPHTRMRGRPPKSRQMTADKP